LVKVYPTISIGNPTDPGNFWLYSVTLCGPLHSKWQIEIFKNGLEEIKKQGGKILAGGNVIEGPGNYV
jgi:aldehyde dehydrogenase family 7 protein A1